VAHEAFAQTGSRHRNQQIACHGAYAASSYFSVSSAVRPVLLRSDREHRTQFPRPTGIRAARKFMRGYTVIVRRTSWLSAQ
jgi:hypothetical protein